MLSLQRLRNRRHTFLCGDAGPLAIGAVVCHKLDEKAESKKLIDKHVYLHFSFFLNIPILYLILDF